MEKEIWKKIPGYEPYEASDQGRVRSGFQIVKAYLTNKGYYRIPLRESTGKKFISVHRAVALAHLANPENKPQVNHKDGDKSNNKLKNLEWMTGGENVEHAFSTGLRNDNVNVTMIDITKDVKDVETEKEFRSLTDLGKYLDIAMDTLISYIPRSGKHPLFNKYIIKITEEAKERMLSGIKPFYKKIYVHDLVNNKVNEYVSMAHASINTGINTYTVREALGRKGHRTYYIGGYLFSYNQIEDKVLTEEDKTKAFEDRNVYLSKPLVKIGNEIELYDYDTKEVMLFNGRQDVKDYLLEKGFSINAAGVTSALTKGRVKKMTGIVRGYGIKFKDDDLEWYPYTKRQIKNSVQGLDLNTRILEITDNSTTIVYYGLVKVATRYNLKLTTLKDKVNKGEEELNVFFKRNNIDATVVII